MNFTHPAVQAVAATLYSIHYTLYITHCTRFGPYGVWKLLWPVTLLEWVEATDLFAVFSRTFVFGPS